MNLKTIMFFTAILFNMGVFAQLTDNISLEAKKQTGPMLAMCKDLHQHPELSFREAETSKRMAGVLEKAGFEVTRNYGGNNVVGIFKNGPGPVIMLRTDMDALPVEEKTGFEFASTVISKNTNGDDVHVMHACGHDVHMSVWAGTINALVALKDQWKGTLLVIAQQAEELSGGSGLAIEAGLFREFPVPGYALAFHINPELESGTIGLVGGPLFAGVKSAEIIVYGKGGHGAYPHHCIDPIVIASRIVLDLQTIVSRELSPLDAAVVTVGSIHGGTRPNIIPDEVKLELTLRYYTDETLVKIVDAIKRISGAAALAAGMPENKLPKVELATSDTPPLINNAGLSRKVHEFASEMIGEDAVIEVEPVMAGEDFGKYGRTPEKVPVCMIWLGSTSSKLMKELKENDQKPAPLHSPFLHPDYEKTIETGIKVMTYNVIGLMNGE